MKKSLCILTVLIPLLISCSTSTNKPPKSYVESQPTFFELRHGDLVSNKWLRKPENLLAIHETFKKVGYENLIGQLLTEDPFIVEGIYINKMGYDLVDSLVLTYKNREAGTKYYKEFWARREKEKNEAVVFVILKDIQYSYKTEMTSQTLQLRADNSKLNDTLRQLLEIEFSQDTLTNKLAIQHFETLKRLGFHQSAYNLLYEQYKYQNISWNRDSLENTLKQTNVSIYPWFEDDTK